MSPFFPALIARARGHSRRAAVDDSDGSSSYEQLLEASARAAAFLLQEASDLREQRVALLVPPGFHHVALQWAVWRAGGVVVPLAVSHPPAELDHVIRDSAATCVVVHPTLQHRLGHRANLVLTDRALAAPPAELPAVEPGRRAMMLYTSGTTGKPKGVVLTHANIEAQVVSLVEAWGWKASDRTLLVLPLHHVHGIVNVLTCALWSGACCEMPPRFAPETVWERIASGELTSLMAVPTIYTRLIAAWEAESATRRQELSRAAWGLRLMVSGSAALPVRTLERWRTITGQTLLERYGMTEIGMALSNPLDGERFAGHVGRPLPGVSVRLVDDAGNPTDTGPGELEVRGPGVFLEYWRRPEESRSAFRDGWFATGDVAGLDPEGYRILGRKSVDIIKTGGYKVSALEIEEALRTHPEIGDCAVIAVPDEEWGERVGVAVEPQSKLTLAQLRDWAAERLAPYKIPTLLRVVEALPRNALGKVTKRALSSLFD